MVGAARPDDAARFDDSADTKGDIGPLREPDGAGAQVGSLLRIDRRELILVTLPHADARLNARCWFVTLRPASGGRLLAGGTVDESIEQLLEAHSDVRPQAEPGTPGWLAARLTRAAASTSAAGMAVSASVPAALALVLPGSAAAALDGIPLLTVTGDDALYVPALDDGRRLFALMDELLAELEGVTAADVASSAWRSGDLVGGAMIEFKGRFADGRVGRWTAADLREFMLRWLPNTLECDADVIGDVPDCVCAFLRFLSQRGSLCGDELADLEAVVHATAVELPAHFAGAARTGLGADVAERVRRSS